MAIGDFNVFVEGDPRPKGSGSRLQLKGGRLGGFLEMADKKTKTRKAGSLKLWQRTIRDAAIAEMDGQAPLDGPISLTVSFYMAKPKKPKFSSSPATKPDLDKLVRAVGDALAGVVYQDDCRVCVIHASKLFSEGRTGALIIASTLT